MKDSENFYFTFGTDPQFPYGEKDFVLVRAKTKNIACEKYSKTIPNRPGSTAINCAFVYSEEEWINKGIRDRYYKGRQPARIIREL
jgi:hypothetical protein